MSEIPVHQKMTLLLQRVRLTHKRQAAVAIIAKYVPEGVEAKIANIPPDKYDAVVADCVALLGDDHVELPSPPRDYVAERREASRVMLLAMKRFMFTTADTVAEEDALNALLDATEKLK